MSFNRTKVTGRRSLSYYTRTAFFAFRSLGHRPKNVTRSSTYYLLSRPHAENKHHVDRVAHFQDRSKNPSRESVEVSVGDKFARMLTNY